MKTETNDIMKISAFRALVDEATNASFDCGEYELESGEDTETYDKILEKSNDAREKLVSVYSELERENARLQMELDASCNAEELRQYRHANQFLITNQGAYERENARMKRVVGLARDAVESGAVDECYLSLLRDAVSALPNVQAQR